MATPRVENLSLHVADGEFMVLVGPSGCGKTTALRMIAGLEEVSDGTISIGGSVVNNVLPKDRDIAMVFQNYALYPQMTVGQNMGFALKIRNVPKDEIARRVEEAAKILRLTEYLDRRPKALSGGQRQRVAMGRAIVREPQAFLMDEPLVEPRRPAARRDAHGDLAHPAPARRRHHLRHPRPDRGDDHGRPRGGDARGRPPTGRDPRGTSTTTRRTPSSPGFIGSPPDEPAERHPRRGRRRAARAFRRPERGSARVVSRVASPRAST